MQYRHQTCTLHTQDTWRTPCHSSVLSGRFLHISWWGWPAGSLPVTSRRYYKEDTWRCLSNISPPSFITSTSFLIVATCMSSISENRVSTVEVQAGPTIVLEEGVLQLPVSLASQVSLGQVQVVLVVVHHLGRDNSGASLVWNTFNTLPDVLLYSNSLNPGFL